MLPALLPPNLHCVLRQEAQPRPIRETAWKAQLRLCDGSSDDLVEHPVELDSGEDALVLEIFDLSDSCIEYTFLSFESPRP